MTLEEMKKLPKEEQKKIFERLTAIRKKAKVVTYSATYGVGKVKLARSTGMEEYEAEKLLKAFWELNWSIRSVAESTQVRKIGGSMWLYNPVSRFWISLRYERDVFSSLNQSTGVFCFDSWLAQCWSKGLRGVFQAHDEVVVPCDEGDQEATYATMKWAIQKVNENLKLHVALDVDPKFGSRYSEIH